MVEEHWLTLDEGDNDPAGFLTYLIAALQAIDDNVGVDVQAQLEGGQAPEFAPAFTSLLNDVAASDVEGVLVLDDMHVIVEPELWAALASLHRHLPSNLHVVLAGRVDPPLPLGRLRARGELCELRTADLRFDEREAAALLRGVLHAELAPEQAAQLLARTEGWAAGLQLAGLALQGRSDQAGFVAAFSGSQHFLHDLSIFQLTYGHARDAAATLQRALAMTAEQGLRYLPVMAYVYTALAAQALMRYDLPAAEEHAREALKLDPGGTALSSLDADLLLMNVYLARRDVAAAEDVIRAGAASAKGDDTGFGLAFRAGQADLALLRGDLDTAEAWARAEGLAVTRLDAMADIEHFIIHRRTAYRVWTRVLAAQGRRADAIAVLRRLLESAERLRQPGGCIRMLAPLAALLFSSGDTPGALAALERCLALPDLEAWLFVFVQAGEPLRELLRLAAARDLPGPARRLLAELDAVAGPAVAGASRARVSPPELVEPLSERELDVLRLIAAGKPNRDVAEALVVSLNTVGYHLKNIYGKLNVNSRTQAIARARELALIP